MKNFVLAFALSGFASYASAANLSCYLSYFKTDGNVPFMTAQIDGANKLSNFKFPYKKYMEQRGAVLADSKGRAVGEVITTGRSPYKGNTRYFVKGAGDLILPSNLGAKYLDAAIKTGIGMGAGENAVIITSFDHGGDGAGDHVSYRMRCRSVN